MRVKSLKISNFRLLHDVELELDPRTTVFVGRNNTGKTSLAEIVSRFLGEANPRFGIEDFSPKACSAFLLALEALEAGDERKARALVPAISLTVRISYDKAIPEYGPLSSLIVDLDPDCNDALAEIQYALSPGKLKALFDGVVLTQLGSTDEEAAVLAVVGERVSTHFERTIAAVDPLDPGNRRVIAVADLRKLITVDYISAQRGLDDEKARPKDLVAKIIEALFVAASNASDGTTRKKTADELLYAVSSIEEGLDASVQQMVTELMPALTAFGYPGLGGQEFTTRTRLSVEKLLSDYTSVVYAGTAGVALPESHSGLGPRNLILILLTLLDHYRKYSARGNLPGIHLVFIEEPEAHLHPQMQEAFIGQVAQLNTLFPSVDKTGGTWSAQFLISTHSSHIANRAPFSSIRYFRLPLPTSEDESGKRSAEILDLSSASVTFPGLDVNFLHKYLTLTRADLLFADKAILVEGASERILLPRMIADIQTPTSPYQYITVMEVGGAYAHLFIPLLDFLGLPALIITDIDPTQKTKSGKKTVHTKAEFHCSDGTSNATIKNWFGSPTITPAELVKRSATDPNTRRSLNLVFQVPEDGKTACARSLEQAFVLANPKLFALDPTLDGSAAEEASTEIARQHKKTAFAIEHATEDTPWLIPKYIRDGLTWLLGIPEPPQTPVSAAPPAVIK